MGIYSALGPYLVPLHYDDLGGGFCPEGDSSDLTFVDGIFLLVIGGLGMSAPVTAGFGAFHWIVSRGMVFVYGLSLEQGGAYAILAHESNSILLILLGALSYILLMTSRKKTITETP